jgi:AcrR family transcriptional regulator
MYNCSQMGNTPANTTKPRERILETAANLFYANGYRAVGIDRIIAESGVAKMSFYRHFPSKDDLIAAYLQRASDNFWVWLETITRDQPDPRQQLEAIFAAVTTRSIHPACLGCTFMAAALEFPALEHPAHAVALEYKSSVLAKLTELSRLAGAREPEVLGAGLMMLMDGAWSAARMFGPGNHAQHVATIAKSLIAAELMPRDGKKS